jgi:hypothetical protein
VLLGEAVHAGARREVVRILLAAVQHDDQRNRPSRQGGRHVELVGAPPLGAGEGALLEQGALRDRLGRAGPGPPGQAAGQASRHDPGEKPGKPPGMDPPSPPAGARASLRGPGRAPATPGTGAPGPCAQRDGPGLRGPARTSALRRPWDARGSASAAGSRPVSSRSRRRGSGRSGTAPGRRRRAHRRGRRPPHSRQGAAAAVAWPRQAAGAGEAGGLHHGGVLGVHGVLSENVENGDDRGRRSRPGAAP